MGKNIALRNIGLKWLKDKNLPEPTTHIYYYAKLNSIEHLNELERIVEMFDSALLFYVTDVEITEPFFKQYLGHPKLEIKFISSKEADDLIDGFEGMKEIREMVK